MKKGRLNNSYLLEITLKTEKMAPDPKARRVPESCTSSVPQADRAHMLIWLVECSGSGVELWTLIYENPG